ncbi:MAG: prepilin-type N-terminal cleavage/methylation domain-containing protein [Pseudomonadota bacterium]
MSDENHIIKGSRFKVQGSRKAEKDPNSFGYTLIELLISISILVIIITIIGSAIRLGYRSVNAGEAKIASLERLKSSLNIVDAQLQSEVPIAYDGEDGRSFYFKGDGKTLQFSTNYSVWEGNRRGYIIADYRIETNDSGKQTMYVTENIIGSSVKREAKLFDALDEIYFEYFDKNSLEENDKWIEQWMEGNDIPEKIRINFVKDTINFAFIIPLRTRGTLIKTGILNGSLPAPLMKR